MLREFIGSGHDSKVLDRVCYKINRSKVMKLATINNTCMKIRNLFY